MLTLLRGVTAAVVIVAATVVGIGPAASETTNVFSTDFAGGLSGWTTGGRYNSWGTLTEPDGNVFIGDSPSGNYDIGVEAWAMSSTTVNLSGYGTCSAAVKAVLDVDQGDNLRFEVSANGTNWQSVTQWSGSTSGMWQTKTADLTPYVGQTKLYFRFHFVTDGYEQLSGNDGVSLDDLVISCTPAVVASPTPTPTPTGSATASPTPTATPTPSPTASAPAATGTNGPIAWARGTVVDSYDSELWRAEPDGSGAFQLTVDTTRDTQPTFSPDGARLAWARGSDGTQGIFVAPSVGGTGKRLTSAGFCGGANMCQHRPRWSPDGKKIAFQENLDKIVVMNADGSGAGALSFSGLISGFTWSPDATKLVFSGMRMSESDYDLFRMNVDGTGLTRLTNNTWDEQQPAWSPDGTKIAYVSDYSDTGQILAAGIFVMNADGTGQMRITGSQDWDDSNPAWSPDGTKIAFSSTRADNNREIHTMNADGTDIVRITNDPAPDDFPSWGAACDTTCQQQAPLEKEPSSTQIVSVKKPNSTTVKVTGVVGPPHDGATVAVTLARKVDGVFKTFSTAKGKLFHVEGLEDVSVFNVSVKRARAGTCRVKVRFPGDDTHKPSAAKKIFSC